MQLSVSQNAKHLKGTSHRISEHFSEEIANERKKLYPELKKAKSEGKRVKLIRDKLYVEGQLFRAKD